MKKVVKPAFISTVPVFAGYIVLGFGFGIIMKAHDYGVLLTFLMSLLIYAGSMQYAAVGLLSSGASFFTAGITTLMINARHIFYGISMVDKYKGAGLKKAYMIFALTDETYSLVCVDNPKISEENRIDYCFLVSLFNHCYWIAGSVLGAVVGSILKFNSEGIDFVLTALFLTIFIEQWLSTKKHLPALIGVGASALCLAVFGSEDFLIPSILITAISLCFYKEGKNDD